MTENNKKQLPDAAVLFINIDLMCIIRDCGATVGNCSTDGRSTHGFEGDEKS